MDQLEANRKRRGAFIRATNLALLDRFAAWAEIIATATHEGGHGVVARALRRRVRRMSIVRDGTSLGHVQHEPGADGSYADQVDSFAVATIAGELAGEAFMPRSGLRALRTFGHGSMQHASPPDRAAFGDRAEWVSCGRAAVAAFVINDWQRRAEEILRRHRREVEILTDALLERRVLDEKAVRELLGDHDGCVCDLGVPLDVDALRESGTIRP